MKQDISIACQKVVAQRHILGVGTAVAWLTGSCQDKGETKVREDLELSKNKRGERFPQAQPLQTLIEIIRRCESRENPSLELLYPT